MKINILSTGKTSETYLKQGINEYLKRFNGLFPVNYQEIETGKTSKKLPEKVVCKQEAQYQLKKISPNDILFLLDENGRSLSSEGFAGFLQEHLNHAAQNITFLIGGAYGFDDELLRRASGKISLSKMTFTHQMVRLLFVEQLYRAMTIIKGLPYHHA